MPSTFGVDSHALIWFVQGDKHRLGAIAKEALDDPANNFILPAIVLAEASHLILRDRTNIPSMAALLKALDADRRWTIQPIDRQIIEISATLVSITELHDRLITATILANIRGGKPMQLITADKNIRISGAVPVCW